MKTHTSATILSLLLLLLSNTSSAIQCSSNSLLQKYQIDKFSILSELERDTPPSTTKEIWWFSPCDENSDPIKRPEQCDSQGVISCGLTEVMIPDKGSFVTQIINFSKSLAYSVDEVNGNLVITLKGSQWGSNIIDAQWEFLCDTNLKKDELQSNTWQEKVLKFQVRGPSGCLKGSSVGDGDGKGDDGELGKPHKPRKGNGSGFLSFLLWLIFYAVLFTLIYIAVLSFMSTRGGTFDDFRLEFVERLTQFATSLPGFTREVVARIFGRGDTSGQRGGYSAV